MTPKMTEAMGIIMGWAHENNMKAIAEEPAIELSDFLERELINGEVEVSDLVIRLVLEEFYAREYVSYLMNKWIQEGFIPEV